VRTSKGWKRKKYYLDTSGKLAERNEKPWVGGLASEYIGLVVSVRSTLPESVKVEISEAWGRGVINAS